MAFDYSKLRGKIRERYKTEGAFAKALGMGKVAFSQRVNNQTDFSPKEILKSCDLLGINRKCIAEYFFKEKVQKDEQKVKEVIK